MLIGDDWQPGDFLKRHPSNTNESGWLAPDGAFYYCVKFLHDSVARILARPLGWKSIADELADGETRDCMDPVPDACEYLNRRGWVRCCGNDGDDAVWLIEEGRRLTFEQRRELTDRGYDPDIYEGGSL